MNFSHVYDQERFLQNKKFKWIECDDIAGTDCFCDATAAEMLKKRIAPYSVEGIHFLDSGNYHYISKFWTDKIHNPFVLIVFDHHPDMQPSFFSNLLSCGCWVKNVLDTNHFVRKVCIVGASKEQKDRIPEEYLDRVSFYSEQELSHYRVRDLFADKNIDLPVYISIDKDVLSTESAVTNWDQGSMALKELEEILLGILNKQQVIGIDICGECSCTLSLFEILKYDQINNRTNKELVNLVLPFASRCC